MKNLILLIVLNAIIIVSCGENAKTADTSCISPDNEIKCDTFRLHEEHFLNSNDKDSPYISFDFEIPYAKTGNKEFDNRINKAIAKTVCGDDNIQTIEGAHKELIRKEYKSFCDYTNSIMEYYDESSRERYIHFLESFGFMETGHNGYINYSIINNFYEGGAHPCHEETHFNIDPKNGNIITLDDIFKGDYRKGLIPYIKDAVAKYFDYNTFEEALESTNVFDTIFVPNNFLLKEDCVVFIFNELEIARRPCGSVEAEIPYEKIKHLLR